MNFFFPNANQNLLGLAESAVYSLWINLEANSCLNWVKYCLKNTASFLFEGGRYRALSGKPISPGMAKSSKDKLVSTFTASFCELLGFKALRHCDTNSIP